jgi:5-formyltetrahydrofolate cyclo-ligase
MTKSELRAELRAKRRAFVEQRGRNDFVSETLNKIIISNSFCVSFYIASSLEADVTSSVTSADRSQIGLGRAALPYANRKEDRLTFRLWSPEKPLERSPLGFEQPGANTPIVAPQLILTPLLGFDRSLRRLGQGAGHYDRAFEDFPTALRIGIAWSVQEVPEIPTDPWDLPLDAVLTEREWICPPQSRLAPFT